MSKNVPRPRVSHQQREAMLAYMMAHEELARGRVSGADAVRHKAQLLSELASTLNSIGSGATKTPDKWLKCWMDWRSDVKAKAIKLKKYCGGTGGGPGPSPLTQMEETLLQFCGVEMVLGVEDVPDPLEVTDMIPPSEETYGNPALDIEMEGNLEDEPRHKTKSDPLQNALERQATALEQMAGGLAGMASALKTGLQEVAAGLQAVARALEQQMVAVTMTEDH